eukprot:TRINITY_DN45589_c0_g1_i1.p1 TRINITY_DN45589_c0_g1~~TRINITY_DN45589_c0_g1_i1.p1  ORF type:complete len:701 (-),score=151.00 TRINITY_DN45589_c0_g1_i1:124-2226(-)
MGCAHGIMKSNPVQPASLVMDNNGSPQANGKSQGSTPVVPADSSARSKGYEANSSKEAIVMGKYRMSTLKQDVMGEGTSSICRKGFVIETGQEVAIKIYKTDKDSPNAEEVRRQKFGRQIEVLQMLQQPFPEVTDPNLWRPQLAATKPSKLFITLLDYSQDENHRPIPDPRDGVMYVITEVAQYSLKDYLALRREQGKALSRAAVKSISKAIILVVAGLHAKGLVHLDLKPENLMMFNGRLKLIDLDGCVRAASEVSIQDSSISFSPCYCAPEWARFLTDESESKIVVQPHLDVWSVGMTLCELATLDAILKPMYANFLKNGHSHREAGFLFMDWLGGVGKAPLPKSIKRFDPQFHDMLVDSLLVCNFKNRKTLAQCLSDPFLETETPVVDGSKSNAASSGVESHTPHMGAKEAVPRKHKERMEDTSSKAPMHKGTLWKLNSDGNPEEPMHWLRRDMWVACNGSLCYFSIKENKRLVLVDGSLLAGAKITRLPKSARDFAFRLEAENGEDHELDLNMCFSAESAEEYQLWTSKLSSAANMDGIMQTMRLGGDVARERQAFRLSVKNRRLKVQQNKKNEFEPVYKAKLWKLKAEGNRQRTGDWFEREMWISKNGSLVYWSKKEDRELVYYTMDDIAKSTINYIPNEECCLPWAFQVQLPASGDLEFTPGEFAAETEELRDTWIKEFQKLQSTGDLTERSGA